MPRDQVRVYIIITRRPVPMAPTINSAGSAWEAAIGWGWRTFDRVPPKRDRLRREKLAKRPSDNATAESIHPVSEGPVETLDEPPERVTIRVCFIRFARAGVEPIRFRVNPLKDGHFTFSDPRGRNSGTAGTTGIWGTLPPLPVPRPRSLSPTAFRLEAARMVGDARACQILDEVLNHQFFSKSI
jgi:hypothetical protein